MKDDDTLPPFWWLNPWSWARRLRNELAWKKRLLGAANDVADRWETRALAAEGKLHLTIARRKTSKKKGGRRG